MVTAPNPASARIVRPRPASPVGAAPAATILAVGARAGAAPIARISSSTPNDRQEPPCVR